jgi:hypothetical protein
VPTSSPQTALDSLTCDHYSAIPAMAPPPQTIIEDEEEFLSDVAAFHEKRG